MPALSSKRSIDDFYQVNKSTQQVKLQVKIGYKQNAVSTVMINENQIDSGEPNGNFIRSFTTNLGRNKDLIDKKLNMLTIIHDISDDTNITSMRVILTGGVGEFEDMMKKTVSKHGDTATYTVSIEFYYA